MDEYVIINKTTIQKRIEKLKSKRDECSDPKDYSCLCSKIQHLEQVLLFSTSLTLEIEKAFDAGMYSCASSRNQDGSIEKQDYISNLHFDI